MPKYPLGYFTLLLASSAAYDPQMCACVAAQFDHTSENMNESEMRRDKRVMRHLEQKSSYRMNNA